MTIGDGYCIISEGYSIVYHLNQNQIIITMPQTMQTLTSTAAMVTNRRTYLTNAELSALLAMVKAMMERGEENE